MNKIGHDNDERKVQESTKLSVKASINEEKKVRSGQTIVLFSASITIVHPEQARKRVKHSTAELIVDITSQILCLKLSKMIWLNRRA